MATVTLTVVLNSALNFLGILDSGGGATAQQLADGLLTINNLIDNKSSDRLMAKTVTTTTVTLVASTQSYTLSPIPTAIEAAALKLANGYTSPIHMVNATEWTMLNDRDRSSWLIKAGFYDRAGHVLFSPIPLGGTVELMTWAAMTQFADATTPITVQDGYFRWLKLAAAVEIAPQYPSAQITPTLLQDYADATATLRNLNASLFGEAPPSGQIASNAAGNAAQIKPTAAEAA